MVTSIFYVLIHTRYEPVLQRNLGILYEKYIGENIARGGTPLWRKNRFLFIQKVVRNRLVWGMGNVTIFIFQIKKKTFWATQELSRTIAFSYFGVCLPLFLIKSLWKYSLYMPLQPNSLKISCSSTAKYYLLSGARMRCK
jgi:hypothetical protein